MSAARDPIGGERLEIARRAACFIHRIAGYFLNTDAKVQRADLAALDEASSVVLSAVDDPVEADASLAARLELALETCSMQFTWQLPKSCAHAAHIPNDDTAIPKALLCRALEGGRVACPVVATLHHDGDTDRCGTWTGEEDDAPPVLVIGRRATNEKIHSLAIRHGMDALALRNFARGA